jgi:hypothetical protein
MTTGRLPGSFSCQLLLLCLVLSVTAMSQQYPVSSGGCRVATNGIEGCSFWASLPKDGAGSSSVHVTTYLLEPGAPLHTPVAGRDAVVVGISEGTLRNEAAAAEQVIHLIPNSVVFMSGTEKYVLRNTTKAPVSFLLIELPSVCSSR